MSEDTCNCVEEIDQMINYLEDNSRYNSEKDDYPIRVLQLLKERIKNE